MPLIRLMVPLLLALAVVLPARAGFGSYEMYHPDQRFRRLGLEAIERGEHEWALKYLRRAAHYADKPAQAMLAEYWFDGVGGEVDRARAYAWMDLAAERHYRLFLIKREAYWEALTPAERERALAIGAELYARYGDAVAKPRLEQKLRLGSRQSTGSRVGMRGALKVYTFGPSGLEWQPDYYAERHWKPEAYWAEQDRIWNNPVRGQVIVEPLRPDFGVPERPSPEPAPTDGG